MDLKEVLETIGYPLKGVKRGRRLSDACCDPQQPDWQGLVRLGPGGSAR